MQKLIANIKDLKPLLVKSNYGYKHFDPVKVSYIKTHVPDIGDVMWVLESSDPIKEYINENGYTLKGEAKVINGWLEASSILRQNKNLQAFTDLQIQVYAWLMLTDMSFYAYISNKLCNYALNFPPIRTSI